MILISDGGSTKADWIALDETGKEIFRTRTLGLNPAVFSKETLYDRLVNNFQLIQNKEKVIEVFFYGAGCGTPKPKKLLQQILSSVFVNSRVVVEEDILAAVYAASKGKEAVVCILGTGSNSCYFDGKNLFKNVDSLGFILMDEASGNYFGKQLIRDFYYHKMPEEIAAKFNREFDLDADVIKKNLYQKESPNAYLGSFAQFMFQVKENPYIHQLIEKGFTDFFECRILPYKKATQVPIYFIGSIAYFFQPLLEKVARKFHLEITGGVIRRPIDELIAYHRNLIVKGKEEDK